MLMEFQKLLVASIASLKPFKILKLIVKFIVSNMEK